MRVTGINGLADMNTLLMQGKSFDDMYNGFVNKGKAVKYNHYDQYVLKCDNCGKVEFMRVEQFDGILRREKRLPICMHQDGRMHILKRVQTKEQLEAARFKYRKWSGFYSDIDYHYRKYGKSPNVEHMRELANIEYNHKHIAWSTGFDHHLAVKWLEKGIIPKHLRALVIRLIEMHQRNKHLLLPIRI